jgi:hypothetical protein
MSACNSIDDSSLKNSELPWAKPTKWEQNPILRLDDLSSKGYSKEYPGHSKSK